MLTELFSIPIFQSNIDCSKIKFLKEKFSPTNQWMSKTVSSHNHQNELEKESYQYLMSIILKMLHERYTNFEIALSNIWTNKYFEKDYQESHIHPNSTFSFIIYKKVDESKTFFIAPYQELVQAFDICHLFKDRQDVECRSNQIILFPSFLRHGVKLSDNQETIAGNLLFKYKVV